MKYEFKVKKGQFYFKGPKVQLAYFQIALCTIFLILGIVFSPWLFGVTALIYAVFQRIIYKQLKNVSYKAYFYRNCTYKLTENYDQINKLFGVSEIFHHWNSARIGWRCIDGENIELFAYCYINKTRVYKKLITCKTESPVFCEILLQKDEYIFNVLTSEGVGKICHMPRSNFKFSNLFMYRLYPYFGGHIPSPKFMKLELEKTGK
jgi:hypothetical protein